MESFVKRLSLATAARDDGNIVPEERWSPDDVLSSSGDGGNDDTVSVDLNFYGGGSGDGSASAGPTARSAPKPELSDSQWMATLATIVRSQLAGPLRDDLLHAVQAAAATELHKSLEAAAAGLGAVVERIVSERVATLSSDRIPGQVAAAVNARLSSATRELSEDVLPRFLKASLAEALPRLVLEATNSQLPAAIESAVRAALPAAMASEAAEVRGSLQEELPALVSQSSKQQVALAVRSEFAWLTEQMEGLVRAAVGAEVGKRLESDLRTAVEAEIGALLPSAASAAASQQEHKLRDAAAAVAHQEGGLREAISAAERQEERLRGATAACSETADSMQQALTRSQQREQELRGRARAASGGGGDGGNRTPAAARKLSLAMSAGEDGRAHASGQWPAAAPEQMPSLEQQPRGPPSMVPPPPSSSTSRAVSEYIGRELTSSRSSAVHPGPPVLHSNASPAVSSVASASAAQHHTVSTAPSGGAVYGSPSSPSYHPAAAPYSLTLSAPASLQQPGELDYLPVGAPPPPQQPLDMGSFAPLILAAQAVSAAKARHAFREVFQGTSAAEDLISRISQRTSRLTGLAAAAPASSSRQATAGSDGGAVWGRSDALRALDHGSNAAAHRNTLMPTPSHVGMAEDALIADCSAPPAAVEEAPRPTTAPHPAAPAAAAPQHTPPPPSAALELQQHAALADTAAAALRLLQQHAALADAETQAASVDASSHPPCSPVAAAVGHAAVSVGSVAPLATFEALDDGKHAEGIQHYLFSPQIFGSSPNATRVRPPAAVEPAHVAAGQRHDGVELGASYYTTPLQEAVVSSAVPPAAAAAFTTAAEPLLEASLSPLAAQHPSTPAAGPSEDAVPSFVASSAAPAAEHRPDTADLSPVETGQALQPATSCDSAAGNIQIEGFPMDAAVITSSSVAAASAAVTHNSTPTPGTVPTDAALVATASSPPPPAMPVTASLDVVGAAVQPPSTGPDLAGLEAGVAPQTPHHSALLDRSFFSTASDAWASPSSSADQAAPVSEAEAASPRPHTGDPPLQLAPTTRLQPQAGEPQPTDESSLDVVTLAPTRSDFVPDLMEVALATGERLRASQDALARALSPLVFRDTQHAPSPGALLLERAWARSGAASAAVAAAQPPRVMYHPPARSGGESGDDAGASTRRAAASPGGSEVQVFLSSIDPRNRATSKYAKAPRESPAAIRPGSPSAAAVLPSSTDSGEAAVPLPVDAPSGMVATGEEAPRDSNRCIDFEPPSPLVKPGSGTPEHATSLSSTVAAMAGTGTVGVARRILQGPVARVGGGRRRAPGPSSLSVPSSSFLSASSASKPPTSSRSTAASMTRMKTPSGDLPLSLRKREAEEEDDSSSVSSVSEGEEALGALRAHFRSSSGTPTAAPSLSAHPTSFLSLLPPVSLDDASEAVGSHFTRSRDPEHSEHRSNGSLRGSPKTAASRVQPTAAAPAIWPGSPRAPMSFSYLASHSAAKAATRAVEEENCICRQGEETDRSLGDGDVSFGVALGTPTPPPRDGQQSLFSPAHAPIPVVSAILLPAPPSPGLLLLRGAPLVPPDARPVHAPSAAPSFLLLGDLVHFKSL